MNTPPAATITGVNLAPAECFADISSSNGEVDLAAYADAGHRRIAIKWTEGFSYVNGVLAPEQWAAAGLDGLERWGYHFAVAGVDGATQGWHFLDALDRWGCGFASADRPALDLEYAPAGYPQWSGPGERQRLLDAFAATVGRPGILYTPVEYAAQLVVPTGWLLWLPSYGAVEPGIEHVAWQFTDAGTAAGIAGPVDLSTYRPLEQEDPVARDVVLYMDNSKQPRVGALSPDTGFRHVSAPELYQLRTVAELRARVVNPDTPRPCSAGDFDDMCARSHATT